MARLVLGDGPRRVRPRVGPGQTVAVARRRRRRRYAYYGPVTRAGALRRAIDRYAL